VLLNFLFVVLSFFLRIFATLCPRVPASPNNAVLPPRTAVGLTGTRSSNLGLLVVES
jgi:hypothetical protein